jgi:hypothetical protein
MKAEVERWARFFGPHIGKDRMDPYPSDSDALPISSASDHIIHPVPLDVKFADEPLLGQDRTDARAS